MCNDASAFESLEKCKKAITVASSAKILATGRGTLRVSCLDGLKWREREMTDVLLVPELAYNLFSVTKVMDTSLKQKPASAK